MTQIWLKYANSSTPGSWTWSSAQALYVLNFKERDYSERITARTLSGKAVSHKSWTKPFWEVTVGASEMYKSSIQTFLKAFYKAGRWKLSTDNFSSDDTEVALEESGKIPIELRDDNESFPFLTLNLEQKDPD